MANAQKGQTDDSVEDRLREMNEALLISSIRQHELAEQAQQAEVALRDSEAALRTHSEELARFNRVAVGRESRMIEMKKELNALARRHGEAPRYPLEGEHESSPDPAELFPPEADVEGTVDPLPAVSLVPLESILHTDELTHRPFRAPDYQTENRALAALAKALADSPRTILQTLADMILEIFQADSAGLSLLTTHDGAQRFYWPAIAGAWKAHVGGGTPRDFGPCGDVLDCDAPMLFKHFERRYPYLLSATPAAAETLLVPFHVHGKAVGTIWAMAHDERRKFDAEDLRQLESLGRFASAAYQATQLWQAGESHRAALNLMEDAVQARQAMEQLNARLRESERRFREMIDALPAAIYTTDAEGRLTHFNRAAAEFSGRVPNLGTDQWCVSWNLYYPDGTPMPHDESPMAIALKEGRIVSAAEAVLERPDGTRVWFTPYPTPLLDAVGRVVGGINMLMDITERKRTERVLHESEERYRTVAEQVKDYAIFRIDIQGRALTWNQGVQRILGFAEAEFLGQDIVEIIFTPEDVQSGAVQRELDTAAAQGTASNDRWMRRRNGERFFANGVTTALKSDSGELVGFTKVMRDVTEQHQMQNQIEEQAERLADESRRKDEFLAMLSHELRNPLASIVNATQLLRLQQDRNPIQTQAHGIINRQVAQLAHLVDDLLEVSRISTGRIRLNAEHVDLRSIIQRALETTQPQVSRKGQSLAQSLPDDPLWVMGDPMRLEQVVVNLLNNAVKYTDRGGDILVALHREGNDAILRVRDTGVGIAPDMLPRIFDLFTQADRSLDRAQGGLGIGLSLVQSLVSLHGGRVAARSTLGKGSEFIVTLPILPPQDSQTAVTLTEAPPAHALKVLVVDDNIDAAQSVAMLLQALGHDARLAHDGVQAMKAALEYRPDVVLLDIGLPLVDGFAVAKRLRQEPALGDVVLVALTGYGQESDRQQSREAGFDHHLVKPVDFAKIESILLAAAPNAG